MEIRTNRNASLDGLTSILGVPASAPASYGPVVKQDEDAGLSSFDGDWATLSTAGSRMAQAATDAGVREGKVAAIRSAIAAGSYAVPAQSVASRAIGAMLEQGA